MSKLLPLALLALLVPVGHADASTKKEKKAPSEATTQSQQAPKPTPNAYGAGCKNQSASIMSGGCVN